MQRLIRLTLLPVAALTLSGCVAAALPALAGGAMTRSEGVRGKQVTVGPAESNDQETQLADATAQPDNGAAALPITGEYSNFARFAQNRARLTRIDFETPSAILRNPGLLDGERLNCGDLPPSVLIDLDDKEDKFGPQDAYIAPPALAAELAELRADGIVVGWISGASMDDYIYVRYALSKSGLDPEGQDKLLLAQHPDDRKQTNRANFAESHCIVAIAGDTMADFDELFLFLTNSDAARPLNAIVGDGWFLVPHPLNK